MTEKQMAHMTPAQAAEKAIRKTLERIIEDPTIGYLFGVGTSTWSFLSEAYAMLQGVPVEDVRKNCIPKNAKDPKETYAPVPENSSNNFGEGHIPREGCPICGNDVEGARDLRDAVKDLVAIHASHLTPGPCHLASNQQLIAALREQLERAAK